MKHKIDWNILSLHIVDSKEKILFAPLNWGLGHATRIVPLIKQELAQKNEVVITASGNAYSFLKQQFPDVAFIRAPEYKIRYALQPFFTIALLLQMPFFFLSFYRDNFVLKQLIKQHGITKVISDNRYGFYNKNAYSVLLTHQLFIKLPKALKLFEPLLNLLTKSLIGNFNECWVPDYENINKSLGGKLSHGKSIPQNVKYIGPLSRFSTVKKSDAKYEQYNVVALISGPEPQRTKFEKELISRYRNYNGKVLFICGNMLQKESIHIGSIKLIPHASDIEMLCYLKGANKIIARSGYSTIMDLHVLGVEAELIPTPGQTEQEYLALWHKKSCLK